MLGGGGGDTSVSVLGSRSSGGNDREFAATASVVGGCNGSNIEADVAGGNNVFDSNGNNMNNYSGEDDKGRVDESERSFGGNRWPRQETVALLKIRSDMDVSFREASVKGPLWEEVSRKLAELGYNRSAKKCKEKFENVYKYHKRTKDGRSGKVDGKTYRFFEQLEAFQNQPSVQSPPPQPRLQPKPVMVEAATNHLSVPQVNVSSAALPGLQQNILLAVPPNPTSPTIPSFPNFSSADLMSNSTSSSTSSDLGLEGQRKRKRNWKEFFERLIKEVIEKQEEMQKKFLKAIQKRDRERMVREEAWRMQEVSRLNREREILAQERSMAAAKDAAVMTFLQKLSEQKQQLNPENNQQKHHHLEQQRQAPPKQVSAVALADPPPPPVLAPVLPPPVPLQTEDNGDQSYTPSSSRWPKFEIEALIKLRTELDAKYQDNGPKGPFWEEISSAMKRLGYNRNAKRCKEKWENINKYFKKVKESNKKRPEDSKTCPYFHQLDALYREKNKHDSSKHNQSSAPLMVRPKQQWPPPPHQPQHDHAMEDMESDQNQDENEVEDEDEAGSFEIVVSKPGSMSTDE